MSERGNRGSSRGGGGGQSRGGAAGRGRVGGGGRGGSNNNSNNTQNKTEERKKEVILDLAKFVDKKIRVKFQGGREVQGTLKGYDQLMNLVLDDVDEYLPLLEGETEQRTRSLGLAVLRGTALTVINPADGFEQIANPFASSE